MIANCCEIETYCTSIHALLQNTLVLKTKSILYLLLVYLVQLYLFLFFLCCSRLCCSLLSSDSLSNSVLIQNISRQNILSIEHVILTYINLKMYVKTTRSNDMCQFDRLNFKNFLQLNLKENFVLIINNSYCLLGKIHISHSNY